MRSCVYILTQGGRPVYVGRTKYWPKRIKAHTFQFDGAFTIKCHPSKLNKLERAAIEQLKPVYNVQHNGPLKRRLTDEWVIQNNHNIRRGTDWIKIAKKARLECGYSPRTSPVDIWQAIRSRTKRLKGIIENRTHHSDCL